MGKTSQNIAYVPVLLTYLDVLGFREKVKKTQLTPSEVKKTHDLLKRLQQQYSQARRFVAGQNNKAHNVTQFRSFSDLMIRVTEIKQADDTLAGYLNWELVVLASTQCDCVALAGDMLRGAIVSSDLYIDKNVTFGPALVEAYLLESSTAVFPRIVIDADLLKRAEQAGQVWHDYTKRGEDGVYFVDYLFGSYLDKHLWPNQLSKSADEILTEHKQTVEKRLKEFEKEKDYRKRQKAIWMAQYHNSTVKRLEERFQGTFPNSHFAGMEIPEDLFEY